MAYQSLRDNLISNVSKPKMALLAVALSSAFSGGVIAATAPVMSVSPHYSADQADKDAEVAAMVKKILPDWNNGKGAWARIKDTQKIGLLAQALMKPTTTNANGTRNQGGIVDTMVRNSFAIDDIGLVVAEHGQKLAAVKSFDKDANVLVLNDVALSGLTETALAEGGHAAATTGQMFAIQENVNTVDVKFKDYTNTSELEKNYLKADQLDGKVVDSIDKKLSTLSSITNEATGVASIALGGGAEAVGIMATAVGHGATAGTQSVAIGSYAQADNATGTAVGVGALVIGQQGVALGFGSISHDNEVSVGNDVWKRKIVNVRGGNIESGSHQVVTGGQLFDLTTRVDGIEQSSVLISDVDKRIDARIADVGTRVAGLDQQVTQAVLDVKNDVNQNVATAKAEVIEHVAGVKAEVIEHVAGVKADITADMTKRIAKASNGVAIGADRATTYTRDVNANARADAAGSWAAGKGSEATGLNATALNGGVASGNNATAVGLDATASADNTVAMGVNAQATATNSVAVGVNSQTDRANTFAVGNVGGERQMVNVAAGTQDTDGVNVAQLNKGLDGVRGEVEGVRGDVAKVHRSLKGDINKLRKDMSAGIASSMAMAGIPQAYMPGKALLGAGVANYGGYSALAIGGSVISGNGHWITRVQAGASTNGSVSGSVGVGYQW